MIERWNTFRKRSPFIAGCVSGGAVVLLCLLILLGLTSAKGKFGSAETILVEDYARLMVVEFGQSGDVGRARWRYAQLGADGSAFLALLRNDPLTDPVTLLNFARAVGDDVLIRAAETAPTVKNGGSSAPGSVFLILLLIFALTAAGAFFVLTAPALEKWTKPVRVFLSSILKKVGFSGKDSLTKDLSDDPAINYRQPSFKLNEVDGTPQSEAVKPVSKPIAPAPAVEPESVTTDEPALIQPPVAESRPAGRASAEFFEEVRAQGTRPVDEATKQVAFTPDDMPDFLKPVGSSKPDPVVEALIEAISGDDVSGDEFEPKPGTDPDEGTEPELENGSAVDVTAEKHDSTTPSQNRETDIPATRSFESYSVYEAPRRYDRSAESVSGTESGTNDEADISDEGGTDAPEMPAPWDEAEAPTEPTFEQDEEAEEDSWMMRAVSGTVQKRTVEVNPDLSLPLIQYQAIYQLGDDFFDETFSIDELDDEFIGECGIGIAETINTTEPKAVTAFEAWLFDRQDTVTPTVFLLSDYAYRQPEMLERLKNKGQFELMQVGKKVEVETFALKMTLTISEIIYGSESSDPRSYFDKVVFDVKVTRKEAD